MANRLARESSPYLKQHAHNPVDWYPWGAEALETAESSDRPVLLSIGYSACHWCHVMERESFDDPAVAAFMNEHFVNVKVDREERPDVDTIYMRAVQSLTGRGGWPLTVFLTPDGRPFYGGTYFPPEPRHGMPSFRQLLEATARAWEARRQEVEGAADEITGLLERTNREGPGRSDDREGPDDEETPGGEALLEKAVHGLLRQFDPRHGGFGQAPKFPQAPVLEFLLTRHALLGPDEGAEGTQELDAAVHTLRSMARGGIRDHLGGGFHRYSVDARWLVPHFEKMLYDNALLAGVYLRGFQLTEDPELEAVTRETLDYMLADLQAPEGGFYAARDADSEGEEGRYYVWTRDEVDGALAPEDARLFRRCYDVSAGGNFEGRNILHLPHDLDAIARDEEMERSELDRRLAEARQSLLGLRDERVPPSLDTKLLAGWNGLALRALAEAGAALDEPRYLEAAREGLGHLLTALRPRNRLLHQVPGEDGRHIPAFLDDAAAMAHACLSLHEATLEARWLEEALALADEVEHRFRDEDTGLLFDTPDDGESLVVRPREVMDNATPSGSSLAAELFLRVGRLTGRHERVEAAGRVVAGQRGVLVRFPAGFGRLLTVAQLLERPSVEIALLGPGPDEDTELSRKEVGAVLAHLLREAHRRFLPGRVITGAPEGDPPVESPLLESRGAVDGRPAAWVCRAYACQAPVTSVKGLRALLEGEAT
jgi:uncharacterized protein